MMTAAPSRSMPRLHRVVRDYSRRDIDNMARVIRAPEIPDHVKTFAKIIRENQAAGKDTLLIAAPGHLKSTTIGFLILQDLLGDDPHIMMGSQASDVLDVTAAFLKNGVKRLFTDEEVCRAEKGVEGFLWRTEQFMVPGWNPVTKFPSWYGTTTGHACEGMRGKDHAYLDDPADRKSMVSLAHRKDAQGWYDNTFSNRQAKDTTTTIIGSFWHIRDIYMEFIARGFDTHIFPMYTSEMPDCFKKYPNVHWHGLEYEWLWPKKWVGTDKTTLHQKYGGHTSFNLRFLCNPEALKDNRFKADWFHYYTDIPDQVMTRLYILMGVDPATGKGLIQDAKQDKLSLTGIAIIGFDPETAHVYVMVSIGEFLDPVATEKRIIALWKEYHPDRILVEDVAYQVALIKRLQDAGLPAFPQSTESRDKISRIDTLAVPIEQGRILFHKSQQPLLEELLFFPESEHLDRSDALEIAVREVIRREAEGTNPPPSISTYQDPDFRDWNEPDRGDRDETF